MTSQNPNLLVICTQYNEWTSFIYQPFGIFWDRPQRRKVKSISYEEILNDYESVQEDNVQPDILIFDEAIDPMIYQKTQSVVLRAISEKEAVYMVAHQKHIIEYKDWIKGLAGSKWISYQQKKSTEGSTVDMLKKLGEAYCQRKPAVYYQLLADYFFGRRINDLEELQFQLLNSYDQKKFKELAINIEHLQLRNEQMQQLLQRYPGLQELILSLARSTDISSIAEKKLQMAKLFFPDGANPGTNNASDI